MFEDLTNNDLNNERIKCASSYLNNKSKTCINTLIMFLMLETFTSVGVICGIIVIIRDQDLYLLTFIESILFVLFFKIIAKIILELLKIKKYREKIYSDINTLEIVESLIDADKKVDKIIAEQRAKQINQQKIRKEHQYKLDHPKCPNCNGYNTKRITTVNRAISVSVVGLASSKIGKSFECLDCKYKW